MSEPVKKKSRGGLKNWLILGAVGVGGYLLYKKFSGHNGDKLKKELTTAAGGQKIPDPDLNGPAVTKFMIASTRSPICISAPVKGFSYSPITNTAPNGYNTFSATATGHFTRRLLCVSGKKWAEIKPTLTGTLGDILGDTFGRTDALCCAMD